MSLQYMLKMETFYGKNQPLYQSWCVAFPDNVKNIVITHARLDTCLPGNTLCPPSVYSFENRETEIQLLKMKDNISSSSLSGWKLYKSKVEARAASCGEISPDVLLFEPLYHLQYHYHNMAQ